jgi:DNA-directed RNA polymerase subunit L
MDTITNITINYLENSDELFDSFLKLSIEGNDIDNTVINTIRRVSLTDIPIYAFNKFDITKNTSTFNNNYIKLRFRNIPVIGIKTKKSIFKKKIDELDNNIDLGNIMTMDDTINFNDNYKQESIEKLTLYFDYENKTNNVITITTKDCKFYYKENEIKNPYTIDLPLIKIQEGGHITMAAITTLGTIDDSEIFCPISIFTFKKLKVNKYELNLESRGQLEETEILKITIENIIYRLNELKNKIIEMKDNDKTQGHIIIENNDHTIGNLLSSGLRKHNDVIFGGYNMPHLLDDKIKIHFNIKKNNIKKILLEVSEYYITLYEKLKNKL